MTAAEARKHFGLKDTDPIRVEGLRSILSSTEKQLTVWSITSLMRQDLEADKEACEALLKEV